MTTIKRNGFLHNKQEPHFSNYSGNNRYSFQRFVTYPVKISEFLLVQTNFQNIPTTREKPHPKWIPYTEEARVAQIARHCHYTPLSKQKESPPPPSINWQDFLFIGDYSSIFSHLYPSSTINHRSLIVPWSNDYVPWKNPLSRNFLSARSVGPLSTSTSAEEEEAGSSRVCVRSPRFPSSTPARSDNIIIGFNLR